jgi:hypothetical protein
VCVCGLRSVSGKHGSTRESTLSRFVSVDVPALGDCEPVPSQLLPITMNRNYVLFQSTFL